jgi:hypothetical protein
MNVRGSVIRTIDQFVRDKHPASYQTWHHRLSDEARAIIKAANTSKWYPVEEGVLEPTRVMCELLYPTDSRKGAWESGRYSAEIALTGIYKVFVVVSTPTFMLKRATRIITTFYDPSELIVAHSTNTSMRIHFNTLPAKSELIECRIAGWMERALEICGCKELSVRTPQSLAKGDAVFAVDVYWE